MHALPEEDDNVNEMMSTGSKFQMWKAEYIRTIHARGSGVSKLNGNAMLREWNNYQRMEALKNKEENLRIKKINKIKARAERDRQALLGLGMKVEDVSMSTETAAALALEEPDFDASLKDNLALQQRINDRAAKAIRDQQALMQVDPSELYRPPTDDIPIDPDEL
jgi:hypothetical protein